MKILFHDNFLSERGTTTSTVNLARALQSCLGAEICMSCNSNLQRAGDQRVLERVSRLMPVFQYSSLDDLKRFGRNEKFDYFYAQKSGQWDGVVVPTAVSLIHAVFASFQPHGDRYAYISKWLADYVTRSPKVLVRGLVSALANRGDVSLSAIVKRKTDWVPHVVSLVDRESDFRKRHNIPDGVTLIGSLSAHDQFNVPMVRQWVDEFSHADPNVLFVFPNLEPFTDSPRVRFLPRIIDEQEKSDYLHSLDIFLHGRLMGESFGMAICEALLAGKPVLSWEGGHDRNHVSLLRDTGWLYSSRSDLTRLVNTLREPDRAIAEKARRLVSGFQPGPVVERFEQVFLR